MGTCKLIAIAVGTAVAAVVQYLLQRWRKPSNDGQKTEEH